MISEEEINQAVNLAAVAISVEIDRMISSIPGADPEKLTEQLLDEVSAMSGSRLCFDISESVADA